MGAQSSVLTFDDTHSRRVRNGMTALVLYSLGHFFIDLYSSAVGAFQPLLVDRLHFSLTQAGLLGAVMTFSGSFVQPAYGYLSDRYHSRMFSALAPAVAGIFIASIGLGWDFKSVAALIFLGGIGIASFHPQASARATLGMKRIVGDGWRCSSVRDRWGWQPDRCTSRRSCSGWGCIAAMWARCRGS